MTEDENRAHEQALAKLGLTHEFENFINKDISEHGMCPATDEELLAMAVGNEDSENSEPSESDTEAIPKKF